ncbi:hypothetical protein TSUD_70520 [Trifolium subterraneum]|uniref:Uncharacterized protein n=1 Tax=Trifolium subterraneum TaxID=3900 RepID=A0A2Z6MPD7_TRISU|nr:hypothetical protein TSUD_70520 [Trifolium subterraneum]
MKVKLLEDVAEASKRVRADASMRMRLRHPRRLMHLRGLRLMQRVGADASKRDEVKAYIKAEG